MIAKACLLNFFGMLFQFGAQSRPAHGMQMLQLCFVAPAVLQKNPVGRKHFRVSQYGFQIPKILDIRIQLLVQTLNHGSILDGGEQAGQRADKYRGRNQRKTDIQFGKSRTKNSKAALA